MGTDSPVTSCSCENVVLSRHAGDGIAHFDSDRQSERVQSSVVQARSTGEATIDRQLAGDTMDSGTTTRPLQRLQATRFVVVSVTSASVYVAPEMEGSQLQLIDEVSESAVGLQKRHGRWDP